jgi:serine/threonine-protein kinase
MSGEESTGASPPTRVLETLGLIEVGPLWAEGGMARVYRGAELGPDGFRREVALKVSRPEWARDRTFARHLAHEAALLARLSHPNIPRVHRLVDIDGVPAIVMEWLEGQCLHTLLDALPSETRALPPTAAARVALEVARALAHAHGYRAPGGARAAIVHGDVSPSNILVTPTGRVILTDFGAATLNGAGPVCEPGVLVGKWAYMAPERLAASRPSPSSDLYSLGLVLFEALAGRPAYTGAEPEQVLAQHKSHERPRWPARLVRSAPALVELGAQLLAPRPRDRPGSASAVVRALDQWLAAARQDGSHALQRAWRRAKLSTQAPPHGAEPARPGSQLPPTAKWSGGAEAAAPR